MIALVASVSRAQVAAAASDSAESALLGYRWAADVILMGVRHPSIRYERDGVARQSGIDSSNRTVQRLVQIFGPSLESDEPNRLDQAADSNFGGGVGARH